MNNTKTEFGMHIARHCILKEIGNGCQKNFVMSPLLLHISLNMMASASIGRTLQQLLRFLESESITDLNAQSSLFMELATSRGSGPSIFLANGIWVHHRFPLKPSFKRLAQDIYKAKPESVDFENEGEKVRDEINSIAREASKGHIDPFLPRGFFTRDAIALLASAVYFNGTWVERFDDTLTKDEDFYLLNGRTIKVPFMKMNASKQLYGSFESFKLLKMEYKSSQLDSKKYAMYIFLPHKKDGLQELVEKFHYNPRFFVESQVKKELLNELWLPKLKYEYELKADEIMKELGLNLPFDETKAEIANMIETREVVYLSKAIQKSYIEVNEEGTVATAVTGHLCGGALHPLPPVRFIADHPFMFTIKEEVSNTILFVGASLNPMHNF